jgi:hypothetical protein
MEENVRLFFTATPDELKTTCATLEDRVSLIVPIVENDSYLSSMEKGAREDLIKSFVACLHIAYKNGAAIDIELEEDSHTAYVCLCAENFIFLYKESISLTAAIINAKGIEMISEEDGLINLYFDFSIC